MAPEYNTTNAGIASTSVDPNSQDAQDIYAMSDQAKKVASTRPAAEQANTQRNLDIATGKKTGQMQALNDRVADHAMRDSEIDMKQDPRGYLDALSKRIEKMKTLAEEAKETTGNMKAYVTYRQVATILQERLNSFQTAYAKQLEQTLDQGAAQHLAEQAGVSITPSTQPAGGQ